MTKINMVSLKDVSAKSKNRCSNPFCDEFCEIPHKYNLCIKCFKKLVNIIGNIHKIYNYETSPPTARLSQERAIRILALDEHTQQMNQLFQVSTHKKSPSLTVRKGDSSE